MHCGRFEPAPLTRREMLQRCASGFGAVALAAMWADTADTAVAHAIAPPPRGLHLPARARNVIFLYMDGGPSQVDTFDYKPMLEKHHGKNPAQVIGRVEKTQFDNNG